MRRLWLRLTCNWFVIGLTCAIRGHRWHTDFAGCCVKTTACEWCGKYRGAARFRDCPGQRRWHVAADTG